MSTSTEALTFQEFLERHAGGHVDVLDGQVRGLPMAEPLHGRICVKAARFLDEFVETNQLGYVCGNDTFV
jgi:Uma2 family endonuclease